jgi:poly(ADP-ribose) glycohydrolase
MDNGRITIAHVQHVLRRIHSLYWSDESESNFDFVSSMFESLPADVRQQFLSFTFPVMCTALANELHSVAVCDGMIPFLAQNVAGSISFSPKQAFLLIACSFLCIPLFSEDGEIARTHATFHRFFVDKPNVCAKLHCMLNYFNLIVAALHGLLPDNLKSELLSEERSIILERLVDTTDPDESFWCNISSQLVDINYRPLYESIEVHREAVQADFANKSLGGGVLRRGCVQEEIRFMISPECLLSVIVCDKMKDNESVLIRNTVIFSEYTGYSSTFRCKGFSTDIVSCMNQETNSLHHDDIVAFDAIPFGIDVNKQFRKRPVLRELNKCLIALSYSGSKPFATGNWGCGAFGGDTQLKAVIQWLSASVKCKDVIFCPFDDSKTNQLPELVRLARSKPYVNVGWLCKSLFQGLEDGLIRASNCIDYLIKAMQKISIG